MFNFIVIYDKESGVIAEQQFQTGADVQFNLKPGQDFAFVSRTLNADETNIDQIGEIIVEGPTGAPE
jgi:hypothetical protein